MNHELDVINRLVEYHDNISAPPVPLTEDLQRGRRRVRRNRGLLAGGVTIGLASLMAAVSIVTGVGSPDHPQPMGPPGLSAPLVAPKALSDVRELGFHVEPVEGSDPETGWSIDEEGQEVALRWGEIGMGVNVRVFYQGVREHDRIVCTERQPDVRVHGVPGCYTDKPEDSVSEPTGIFDANVVWEYAPDSWASVSASYERARVGSGRVRSALLEVAEAVAPGGEAVRVPVHVDGLPPLVQPDSVDSISVRPRGPGGVAVDFHAPHLYFNVRSAEDGQGGEDCEPAGTYEGGAAPFVFRRHTGCLFWRGTSNEPPTSLESVHYIELEVDGTVRGVMPRLEEDGGATEGLRSYSVRDVKEMLADLTVAPLEDSSAWFDLRRALGG